ncbi:ATP-binding protein [Streptomyces sp. RB6PN25]|uniref:ATP-binding protein n=1 Tax=Streptomyces humicola TaxID=2953240 RepID=A0ABT1PTZ6_9ACTN|nr:ATP-binding protein [Streptomyces humicola]MCQ4081149.1 ATP-binding protein [Streptomyces humicola]
MATVELRFSALPEHVRTARLVAAAVARRAGVDEAVLDEVRLAVGEACTRAVGLHRANGANLPVRVLLTEEEKKFSIEVGEEAPGATGDRPGVPAARADDEARAHPGSSAPDSGEDEGQMGLAVISGLVDDVEVIEGPGGGVIRMSWPTNPAVALP